MKRTDGKLSLGLFKAAFTDFMEDKVLRLSAAVAYYSIFSIAPLLVIAIGVAGLAFGQEAVRGQLNQQLATYIGGTAAQGVESMVQSASKPSSGIMATVVGFIVLLLGASGVFGQLKDALNTIWEVQLKSGGGIKAFIKERLLSFGMVLVIGFLLLTSLLLTTFIAGFSHFLQQIVPMPPFVWGVATFLISFALVTTLFAFIFKVLPDAKVEWRDVWVGAGITALLFEIGKFGLSFYLGKQAADSSYGAATSIVLLLLWVYYTSCILFYGAEFTQVYAKARGRVIEPTEGAERVTEMVRAQEGLATSTPAGARASGAATSPARAPMPAPQRETLPRPVPQPLHELPPSEEDGQPLGTLLAVTGLSMVLGLLTRGWAHRTNEPKVQFKEGLAGLTREAGSKVAAALDRAREAVESRIR